MRAAAIPLSSIPALNTVDCLKLSPRLAEPRGAPSLGRHAKDAPDAATRVLEISPPDVRVERFCANQGNLGPRSIVATPVPFREFGRLTLTIRLTGFPGLKTPGLPEMAF